MNPSTTPPDVQDAFCPSAWAVLRQRYLRKDINGTVIETPEEMFRRVAYTVAAVEANYHSDVASWEETFFRLMATLRFLPNSPTLMNAGLPHGQLAACFVLPVEDSLASIFQAGIPDDIKALFATSWELPPEAHVRMQSAFQRHTDNAVSKTVNRPETATPADIERVIRFAYQLRCKGITVFRDGCKGSQVLSLGIPSRAPGNTAGRGLQAGLEFTGERRVCTT
jgi:ribonucleotide reductase alpha subunit